MLHGTSLRNVTSHVCSRSIDLAVMSDVRAVLTSNELKDLSDWRYRGLSSRDHLVTAVGKSRDAGAPVAAVAALDEAVATMRDVTFVDGRIPPRVMSEVMGEGAACP